MSVKEKMTAIADAIREKTGGAEPLTLDDMASGINEVYEAGKEKEWSDFWKGFTQNGKRTDYGYAFYTSNMEGVTIDANLCKPVRTHQMFYNCPCKELPRGINFSKRNATTTSASWGGTVGMEFAWNINLLYVYDIGIQPSATLASMFSSCGKLETIEIIRAKEETIFTGTFDGCTALKNITFEGVIGRSISFSSSPLTPESMKNIVKHLKNYAGTDKEYAYTITIKEETDIEFCGLGFTLEDIEWMDENGIEYPTREETEWMENEDGSYLITDFSWTSIIDSLKWNLVSVA